VPISPVADASFEALLRLDDKTPAAQPAPLTATELQAVAEARDTVAFDAGFVEAMQALRSTLAQQGRPVSDRRWRQLVGLMRVAAATEGRAALDEFDLWLVPFVVGQDADAVPRLAAWVDERLGAVSPPLTGLAHAVQAFEKQLELELSLPAEDGDDSAGKLALARAIAGPGAGPGAQDGESERGLLRFVSAQLEAHLKRRFSSVHVAARVAQVDLLRTQVAALRAAAEAALADLQARLPGRLWLPPERSQAWCDAHRRTLQALDGFEARLQRSREGFESLRIDDALPAVAPAPVGLGIPTTP
jgi:MoxR-like ATPase